MSEKRLAEMTELLQRWSLAFSMQRARDVGCAQLLADTRKLLSRAPAQPAAPTWAQPFRNLMDPAAPTPGLGRHRCPLCGDPIDADHPKGSCVPCHELPEAKP